MALALFISSLVIVFSASTLGDAKTAFPGTLAPSLVSLKIHTSATNSLANP